MFTRRNVLRLGMSAGVAGAVAGTGPVPRAFGGPPPAAAAGASATEKYAVPLTVPQVLRPVVRTKTTDYYGVAMLASKAAILPGRTTDVLTYQGTFPGPTIKARSGRRVVVHQVNAMDTPASVHLHGGAIPQESDGGPRMEDLISPGHLRTYTYPNEQPNATLWWHDHAHHVSAEHVYRGLSAAYLLEDDTERRLPLPAGDHDVPLILRDAHFDDDAQLVWTLDDPFSRSTITVNGRPWPYMRVEGRKYRFRLINSTNLRVFVLRLSDGSPFTQIGSDGGLLERPFDTDTMMISPGERIDFVLDFARYRPGTQLVLTNSGGIGPEELVGTVMRFDVGERVRDDSRVPGHLRKLARLPEPTVQRHITMNMKDGVGLMNGRTYDPDRIDTTIRHGDTEVWSVTNLSEHIPHNFHMHLVQFRVLARNGESPAPAEAGLKDTVFLLPGETVELQATFDTYRGVFPYHCHMLDHSAMGMMAQMRVV